MDNSIERSVANGVIKALLVLVFLAIGIGTLMRGCSAKLDSDEAYRDAYR